MYKAIIRPLLFLIDPERVHTLIVFLVKCIYAVPGLGVFIRKILFDSPPELAVTVAGLRFNNRVGMAAGFDKNADFFSEFSMFGFSFIEVGTLTPQPQPGNPRPRLFRLPQDTALINRMGFNNMGVAYAAERLKTRGSRVIIGGNIGKNTLTVHEKAPDDYAFCFDTLYDRVDYFAVNVSCPNIGGYEKLQDMDSIREILTRIMKIRAGKALRKPVFLKISPDLTCLHVDEILSLYKEVGLDGIIASNTSTLRDGLITESKKIREAGAGGLSGKPLKLRAKELVSYICKQSNNSIPVISVGGIITSDDALDMFEAGASLIQLYTGFIYEGPFLIRKINRALLKQKHKAESSHYDNTKP